MACLVGRQQDYNSSVCSPHAAHVVHMHEYISLNQTLRLVIVRVALVPFSRCSEWYHTLDQCGEMF